MLIKIRRCGSDREGVRVVIDRVLREGGTISGEAGMTTETAR